MEAFVWNDSFLIGEALPDEEHRRLVALINRIISLEASGDLVSMEEVGRELSAYASTHFRHEEHLMAEVGCDARHIRAHRMAHLDFTRRVMQMQKGGNASIFLRFLCSGLVYHILGMDKTMARQFQLIREGHTPAEAFEQAEQKASFDPVAQSLLSALGDLYGVVLERNEALRLLNDRLETLVVERTMSLSRSNEALLEQNTALQELNQRLSETRQQLIQSETLASVGQLAAGVAHEINNPISFVLSNMSSLEQAVEGLIRLLDAYATASLDEVDASRLGALRESIDLDFLREDLPLLMRESKEGLGRVRRIVEDLRTFSRVDSGSQFDLADLVPNLDSALNLLEAEYPGRLKVCRDYAGLPPIECRIAQINQVFMSLLNNAAEAVGEKGGTLSVRAFAEDDQARIEFSDNGAGMSEEIRRRIFDPFFTTRPVGQGQGLGLSLAYGIMRQHGGQIEVESEPGHGSIFRLSLPLRQVPT